MTENNFLRDIEKKVFVIAEAGSNHDRKLDQAKRLVDVAVHAKADAVKFQLFTADTLYSKRAPRLSEMEGRSKSWETPYEILKKLELPPKWIKKISNYCNKKGIMFMATPFSEDAVDYLNPYVNIFKVSGYDIDNYPMLEKIAKKNKPVILSTGTSTIKEIKKAMEILRNVPLVLLHCTNQYPTKPEDVNILAMKTIEKETGLPIGLSDHTLGNEAAIAAVALGARVIEKHITIDKTLPGPDHPHAMNPDEFKEFVQAIRTTEIMLGNPEKKPTKSEEENVTLARRSIHAKVIIPKGTKITKDMLILKRPALGIKPIEMKKLIGKRALRDIKEDEWITWNMVGD